MLTFKLFVEEKLLIDFKTFKPTSDVLRLKIKDDYLSCCYKYIDRTIIDMIFNCDQYLPIAVTLNLHPDHIDRLSTLIFELTKTAPDLRFFHTDLNRKEEFLLHFEFNSESKISGLKLIKLVVLDTAEHDMQTLENRISQLKDRQKHYESVGIQCNKETEKLLKDIDELKRKESILSSQTDELNHKHADLKQRLGQIPKHDETLRELQTEKDHLAKLLQNITRDQALKRKETLDSLAKRYETLKTDMMGELNKSLNEYIESEKKQKASLKLHMQRQAMFDTSCKIGSLRQRNQANSQRATRGTHKTAETDRHSAEEKGINRAAIP